MYPEAFKNLIRNQYREFKNYRQVAKLNNLSDSTVRKWVANEERREKKKPGPKPKITKRDERRINRAGLELLSREERVSAPKIRRMLNLRGMSDDTIRRAFKRLDYGFDEALQTILLTPHHKQRRLDLCSQWLRSGQSPFEIVFTDEKRFNGDGPDSWKSWMPKGKKLSRNRRQQGGPSLQVYGALIPGPRFCVWKLSNHTDSEGFMDFIEDCVLPTVKLQMRDSEIAHWKLQQDHAAIQSSIYSTQKFCELEIDLLDWPSRSPDLNLVEDVWSMLTSIVYDGPQLNSKEEIWNKIEEAVYSINDESSDKLNHLFDGWRARLLEVDFTQHKK